MNIIIYQSLSESNVVNKQLTELANANGTLREETSIIDPVILFEDNSNGFTLANYIYIPDFNRYYFINDITSVRNGLWQISCHVDVLMSWKNYFLNLSGIVARQENLYNLYLNDDKFLVNSNRQFVTKAFPNRVTEGGLCYVMTVAGGDINNVPPAEETPTE